MAASNMEVTMWAAKGQIVQVREIMHRNVQKINTDIILAEAAKKMRDLEIGCLLVLDQEKLVGILTDRDIVCRAIAEDLNPVATKVTDVMSKDVAVCYDNLDVEDAAQIMGQRKIRRLPVLDSNKNLVGIITLSDLASGSTERTGAVVRSLMRH